MACLRECMVKGGVTAMYLFLRSAIGSTSISLFVCFSSLIASDSAGLLPFLLPLVCVYFISVFHPPPPFTAPWSFSSIISLSLFVYIPTLSLVFSVFLPCLDHPLSRTRSSTELIPFVHFFSQGYADADGIQVCARHAVLDGAGSDRRERLRETIGHLVRRLHRD